MGYHMWGGQGTAIQDSVYRSVSTAVGCGEKLEEKLHCGGWYACVDRQMAQAIVLVAGEGSRDPLTTTLSTDYKWSQLICWLMICLPALVVPLTGLYISHETGRNDGAYCANLDPAATGSDAGVAVLTESTKWLGWWLWFASGGMLYISMTCCSLPLFGLCKCALCNMDLYEDFEGDISTVEFLGPRRAAVECKSPSLSFSQVSEVSEVSDFLSPPPWPEDAAAHTAPLLRLRVLSLLPMGCPGLPNDGCGRSAHGLSTALPGGLRPEGQPADRHAQRRLPRGQNPLLAARPALPPPCPPKKTVLAARHVLSPLQPLLPLCRPHHVHCRRPGHPPSLTHRPQYANPDIECGICPGRLSMCWFYCNFLIVIMTGVATAFFVVMLSFVHGSMRSHCYTSTLVMADASAQDGPALWIEAEWVLGFFWLQPLWVPFIISCGRKIAWRFGGNPLLEQLGEQVVATPMKPVNPLSVTTSTSHDDVELGEKSGLVQCGPRGSI